MPNNHELPFNYESNEIHRLHNAINRMEHELFFLYVFLTSEGICEEACTYLEDHQDDPVPFKMFM